VFSSIHARLHRSQARSLKILSRLNYWYLEDMDNQSGTEIEVRDFASNNDIRPVSDPNIFSETQRVAQAQAVLQMATSAPQLYDLRAAHRRVLKQLKIPAISEILPDPDGIKEANPALENVAMSMGRPAAAYPDQDHLAHIRIHLAYAQDPNYGGSPLIGPAFSPHVLEHIKQHLTLHYLQSMRAYVAQAAGGQDTMKLHEEKPLTIADQQALAVASQMVAEDSAATFQQAQPMIMEIAKKVQEAKKAQAEQAAQSDPAAQVILKTQMAETERKSKEFQAKMEQQVTEQKQNYDLQVAELHRKVAELQAKYETQTQIDSQKNSTAIATANINNASRERVAMINANMALNQQQVQLEHEQNQSAIEAIDTADRDIREHGITVQQNVMDQENQRMQDEINQQREMQKSQQQHIQGLQQLQAQGNQQAGLADQQHQQALVQQVAQPTPPIPTGEI
jgi:hypothetical protein